MELTDAERAAVDALVPPDVRTGNDLADLTAAAQEAWKRRQQNTDLGGAVLAALYRAARSWRAVGSLTGIPTTTARRWATPPAVADAHLPEDDEAP